MEKLMAEMKRKGLFPSDGSLEEFTKLYGNTGAMTKLHGDLVEKKDVADDNLNYNNFLSDFDISFTKLGQQDDPFRIEGYTGDAEVTSNQNTVDLKANIDKWYNTEKGKLDPNAPNYDAQLKNLNKARVKQLNDLAGLHSESQAFNSIIPYAGTEENNPSVEFQGPDTYSADFLNKDTDRNSQQAMLETEYNDQEGSSTLQTGLHSWMFPETNVNLQQAGEDSKTGQKDTQFKLANKLWTISDEWSGKAKTTLIPVLEENYPGYKFTAPNYGDVKRNVKGANGVEGNVINVIAPNGEKTTIYGGLKLNTKAGDEKDLHAAVLKEKVKLANFINTHGIDMKKVGDNLSAATQTYKNLLNVPYNEVDINKGGIGLDEGQEEKALSYGTEGYVKGKDGKVKYDFTYNPNLFLTPRGMLIATIEQEYPGHYFNGVPDVMKNLSKYGIGEGREGGEDTIITRGIETYLKDMSRKKDGGDFSNVERGRDGWGIHIPGYGWDTDTPHYDQVKDRNKFIKVALKGGVPEKWELKDATQEAQLQYGNTYHGPGTKIWKDTKKALLKTYKEAGVKLTDEIIKTTVAQRLHSEYVNGAVDENLNEYLWKADNNNRKQALAGFSSIVTQDATLNTAMALQGLNEAEIVKYNAATPDLTTVENFEDIYNDPDGAFDLTGLDDNEITTLKNGKQVPINTFNSYITAKERRNNTFNEMLKRRSKAWQLQDDAGDINANIKLLEKDYNTWTSSLSTLGLAFGDIGVGLTYLAGKAAKYGSNSFLVGQALSAFTGEDNDFTDFWEEWDKEWADKYDDYSSWKNDVKEQYGREVSFHENKFGRGGAFSPGNFGRFAAQEVAKQIPIIATMIATGGTAGPLLIGAYSAGQHWADADRREYLTGEKESEWKQAAAAIGYGAAEAIFERLTTVPILNRGKKLIQGIGEESFLSYRNAMKQYFKENALHVVSAPVLEASAEFGTQLTQNLIDGRPMLEGADHAAFVGGMFGHAMSVTPFVGGALARQFTDYNSFSEYKKRQDKINTLERNLNIQKENGLIGEKGIKVREENLNNLKAEQEAFLEKQYGAITETMEGDALNKFLDATMRQAEVSEAANEMLDSKTKNDPQVLELYKKLFDANQFRRDQWRNNKNFANDFNLLASTDATLYEEYIQRAKNKLTKDNKGDQIRDDQILPTAQDIYKGDLVDANYKKVSKGKDGGKYKKFDDNSSALDYINDALKTSKEKINSNEGLSDKQKKDKINFLERNIADARNAIKSGNLSGWNLTFDKNGVITADPDAITKSEVLGFRENAIKNNETQIFTHEASHDVFGQILGYDSEAFIPIAKEIETFLKSEHADIWTAMVMKRGSELAKADEVVMNFLEYVGNNKIDFKSKKGGLFSSAFGFNLNKVFKDNNKQQIDYHGQNGTIDFLINLGKSVSEGRINAKTLKEAKESIVIKEAKRKHTEAKRKHAEAVKKFQNEQLEAITKKVLTEMGVDPASFKFSNTSQYTEASQVIKEMNELVKANKKSPVKGYRTKLEKLTNEFKRLKASAIVKTVPKFNTDETNAQRKERVNLTERSFRGELETARQGAPMNEIVKGYENNMLNLARKSGIFNTDAYQNFDTRKEAEQEFLSEARFELIKAIRNFKPSMNNDFDAWIMSPKILPNKVKGAHNNIVKRFADKGQGFTTGLEAASGVATEESVIHELDKTLSEVFNIKKGDPLYNSAVNAVTDVMKKGLPKFEYTQRKKKGEGKTVTLAEVKSILAKNPTSETLRQAERDLAGIYNNVKSQLEASYIESLDKIVKKELLNTKVYDKVLEDAQADLMQMIPIQDLVALERLVKGKKILTKEVKKDLSPAEVKKHEGSGNLNTATTTQGPTLYSRQNPTTKEFVDFFNVRGRKNAIAKIISKVLGLDATMQTLSDPKIVNEITKDLNKQEAALVKEQFGEQVLKDYAGAIKRGLGFKFSIAHQVGMDENLSNEYNSLQGDIINKIVAMGVTNVESVKLAVAETLENKKWKPYRTKVKNIFQKLLKPYNVAIAQTGDVKIDLLDYIQNVEINLESDSIGKRWGTKPMSQAFANATDVKSQKKFFNRLATQSILSNNGNMEKTALQFLRYQRMFQNGTKVGTTSARGMLYGNVEQMYTEFFMPNFGFIYPSNTKERSKLVKNSGKKRQRRFKKIDGTYTAWMSDPQMPTQAVSQEMIDNTMSKENVQFREDMAKDAWDFTVNIYKHAKAQLDAYGGGASNLNIAMLMNGMGQFMDGPIRLAAPFRYSPINLKGDTIKSRVVEDIYSTPLTELKKGKGTFKDGVFKTKDAKLAIKLSEAIDMRHSERFENGWHIVDFTHDPLLTTKNKISNPWAKSSAYHKKTIAQSIKNITNKNFEYEHGIPAKVVNLLIADAVFNPKSKVDLKKLQESYAVGAIAVNMNSNMSTFFGERMQFGYEVGDIAPKRWFNRWTRGGAAHGVVDVRTGEKFGEKEHALWKETQKANQANKYSLNNNVTGLEELDLSSEAMLQYAAKIDAALQIARDPNAPIKKIRVFDFDDTLATTNSNVIYNKPNTTGKPSSTLKAIVMAGGPGSGKSTVIKGLGLQKQGYKVVNQDISLEWAKELVGLDAKEAGYDAVQRSVRGELGALARKIAEKKLDQYTNQGTGVILDGTGASIKATRAKVQALKDMGYEVSMIYVETAKKTALERNQKREERSLQDFIVAKTWDSVNANKQDYKNEFGESFFEVNTDNLTRKFQLPNEVINNVHSKLNATIRGKISPAEFAKKGTEMEADGAIWDFSEFNKVIDGERGPLFDVAKKIQAARGTEDVFVLTARTQEAAGPIKQFLESVGLNIPLSNITGLANSSPYAKSKWIIEKAADGFNDFYFADDHGANVKAVKDALNVIDVKSKVQQAKFKFSLNVDENFNKILENSLGIEWYKKISKAKAEIRGQKNQKRKLHPYSAEDFEGLIYPLLGKGKKGDAAYKWFEDHLFNPFARAMSDLATARVNLMDDFRALKKTLNIPKTLKKNNDSGFTNENSVRAYIWTAMGYEIPGLSKTDLKKMNDAVINDPALKLFADELIKINKEEYVQPGKSWLAGTITTDLIDGLNKIKRKEYLSQWKENVDIIFSEKNLNKLESVLGPKYVEALKNSLARMEVGSNRLFGQNRLANQVLDYLNNAQGVVMFLNMRSALLQGISSINFLNWGFNNPVKAGMAFANLPQYAKDFVELMNSDYLKDRRGGLAMNINENEIANAAKTSTNKAKAIISYIIQQGYAPTKFMDSFAIASGGATFFRNRINNLLKKNPDMSEAEARAIAYKEFVEISEKNQQSARPDKISSQQASDLGRLTLNWANTQMQYVRIQKKAIQDITNGRGDFKSNVSKIVYYGVIQNLAFQAAHAALFALGFGDNDDDEDFKEDKIIRTANGAADNILRGLGIGGHTFAVLKNWGIKIYKETQKDGRQDYVNALWELIKLSPVISSKVQRLKGAAWEFNSKGRREDMIDKGFDIHNPAYDATAKVISAVTNIPLDRVLSKFDNIENALSEETETWMDIALLLGWPKWTLEPKPKKEKGGWGKPKTKGKKWGESSTRKSAWGVPANSK